MWHTTLIVLSLLMGIFNLLSYARSRRISFLALTVFWACIMGGIALHQPMLLYVSIIPMIAILLIRHLIHHKNSPRRRTL